MPKVRGGSKSSNRYIDDWLDDQRSKKSLGLKKKGGPRDVTPLAPAEANATVAEVFPKQCRVRCEDGSQRLCSYRRANVIAPHADQWRERAPVAVGDRVKISSTDPQSGVVEGVCERSNFLARPAPDREEGMVHVLAANIDCLVIVASGSHPDFSPGLVDRFLVAAARAAIRPVIAITKVDLQPDHSLWAPYRHLGYEIVELSVRQGVGLSSLEGILSGKKVVFCGHSGVGKTSLINALVGRQVGRVGETSSATGKGRHTTTSAVMIETADGSFWIDTPGVREFGLWGISPEQLAAHFPEFASLSWAVEQQLPNDSELAALGDSPRAVSYRRILRSLLDGEH